MGLRPSRKTVPPCFLNFVQIQQKSLDIIFPVSDHLGDPWCFPVREYEDALHSLGSSATPGARSCSAASALFPVREYGRRARASQRARSARSRITSRLHCSHGSHWLCCFLFLFFPVFGLLAIGCHHLPSKNTPSTLVEFFLQNVFLHKNSHPLGIPPLRLIRMSSKTASAKRCRALTCCLPARNRSDESCAPLPQFLSQNSSNIQTCMHAHGIRTKKRPSRLFFSLSLRQHCSDHCSVKLPDAMLFQLSKANDRP